MLRFAASRCPCILASFAPRRSSVATEKTGSASCARRYQRCRMRRYEPIRPTRYPRVDGSAGRHPGPRDAPDFVGYGDFGRRCRGRHELRLPLGKRYRRPSRSDGTAVGNTDAAVRRIVGDADRVRRHHGVDGDQHHRRTVLDLHARDGARGLPVSRVLQRLDVGHACRSRHRDVVRIERNRRKIRRRDVHEFGPDEHRVGDALGLGRAYDGGDGDRDQSCRRAKPRRSGLRRHDDRDPGSDDGSDNGANHRADDGTDHDADDRPVG